MEEKLNIANILKDKPLGTKLYADAFGELSLECVNLNSIYVKTKTFNCCSFYSDGKFNRNGEPILFPSKEMDDWSKFAWKKGDVLVSNDYGTEVIFYDWYDDTYTNFHGRHYLNSEDKNNIKYNDTILCTTRRYSLEDKDAAQTYINTIEERLGGKLNRKTLEVENTQPEFKDGDIVVYGKSVAICRKICKHTLFPYVSIDETYRLLFNDNPNVSPDECRFATEAEKQQLFSALAKEGKVWNANKKQIVDLKPKIELKPFDKVLVRDGNDEIWEPAFFFRNRPELNVYKYQTVGGKLRVYCIPFNEETVKLIGTSNDWEE